ncbi:MAG: AAA family ATPase [Candidatus Hodarchaeota archaeon]
MSQQLLSAAQKDAQYAYQLDSQGRSNEAIPYYLRAAKTLQTLINYVPTETEKQMYYKKAKSYIYRVKEIRGLVEEKVDDYSGNQKGTSRKGEEKDGLRQNIMDAIIQEKPNVKWEDVANLEHAKRALREAIIHPMSRPDIFKGVRRPWKGVMLFGPPGCGKTYLAKAVASEVSATFFSVSAASIISKWLGESEKLVRTLYKLAREKAPSIVFIDEVDAVGTARGGQSENEAMRRVKTELLQSMDGLISSDDIVVTMGATNIPWSIDLAMRRRFERRVYIALPEAEARAAMFQIHTKGEKMDPSVDFNNLAQWTEGYSAADIALICREALMIPIREMDEAGTLLDKNVKPRPVINDDFITSLSNIKPSVSPEELGNYEDFNQKFGS